MMNVIYNSYVRPKSYDEYCAWYGSKYHTIAGGKQLYRTVPTVSSTEQYTEQYTEHMTKW